MDQSVVNYISTIGLSLSLALLVAFRAGRMRGLTQENYAEKIADLTFDTLKGEIKGKLQECFNLSHGVPDGQNWRGPGRLTMDQIAAHLHRDMEDIQLLQNLYLDLTNQGIQSPYFQQALEFVHSGGML